MRDDEVIVLVWCVNKFFGLKLDLAITLFNVLPYINNHFSSTKSQLESFILHFTDDDDSLYFQKKFEINQYICFEFAYIQSY
jgi:hypothetical protein